MTTGLVPGAVFKPRWEMSGPMGRVHLTLPCGHQRISLNWYDSQPGATAKRTCRKCRRIFTVQADTGPEDYKQHKATVTSVRFQNRRAK
jgi:hypothetical protein